MIKTEFCILVQPLIKEVRESLQITQEEMMNIIGVSKKTLIQIEKNRIELKWPEAVTFVQIFSEHDLVRGIFGDESLEIIQSIAKQKVPKRQLKTMGGEIWWKTIKCNNEFTIQQHTISKHYRILDKDNYRVFFSYSKKDVLTEFTTITGEDHE